MFIRCLTDELMKCTDVPLWGQNSRTTISIKQFIWSCYQYQFNKQEQFSLYLFIAKKNQQAGTLYFRYPTYLHPVSTTKYTFCAIPKYNAGPNSNEEASSYSEKLSSTLYSYGLTSLIGSLNVLRSTLNLTLSFSTVLDSTPTAATMPLTLSSTFSILSTNPTPTRSAAPLAGRSRPTASAVSGSQSPPRPPRARTAGQAASRPRAAAAPRRRYLARRRGARRRPASRLPAARSRAAPRPRGARRGRRRRGGGLARLRNGARN